MAVSVRRQRSTPDIWPGFVDAISSLLIIVIFLLMVFTLAQYFLSELLSGRNEALDRLNLQVAELSDMLALERSANTELRSNLSQMSGQLQTSISERDRLSIELAELMPERDALSHMLTERTAERDTFSSLLAARTAERNRLSARLDDTVERANQVNAQLEDAYKTIEADKEKIELQLRRVASLERDVETLGDLRKNLEARVAKLSGQLSARDEALTTLRDRSKELEAHVASEQERTALAQREIDEKDVRLAALLGRAQKVEEALTTEQTITREARRQVELLNLQIAALRQQLARISTSLEVSEAKSKSQQVQILDLGRRLNTALARKVQELARYRSEFFGRLREVVGERGDIRIVGDRFVFQSEVLFTSGSADLQDGGKAQIAQLAKTLKAISAKIPSDINWVLRVDGHTDRVPIATSQFPSNWELSTGRATAVVKYLVELGLPSRRLAATGFGEHQPLDQRDDEIAYRRNRRIEFKLTER